VAEHPSVPLPGYYVAEVIISPDSPAAGRKLGDVTWPAASVPVSVLRRGSLGQPRQDLTLAAGDRVSLLIPAVQDAEPEGAEPAEAELPRS
jgi:Trk K+ transport system NAD-binding subunit